MISWYNISKTQSSVDIERAIRECKLYVYEQELHSEDLCDILGHEYFFNKLYIDEIMEQFVEMVQSDKVSMLKDGYSFVTYFFKCQLYTKQITIEEANEIYQIYFKPKIYQVSLEGYKNLKDTKCEETKFVSNLVKYKVLDDEGQDYVYDTLLQYLKDLKITF